MRKKQYVLWVYAHSEAGADGLETLRRLKRRVYRTVRKVDGEILDLRFNHRNVAVEGHFLFDPRRQPELEIALLRTQKPRVAGVSMLREEETP